MLTKLMTFKDSLKQQISNLLSQDALKLLRTSSSYLCGLYLFIFTELKVKVESFKKYLTVFLNYIIVYPTHVYVTIILL